MNDTPTTPTPPEARRITPDCQPTAYGLKLLAMSNEELNLEFARAFLNRPIDEAKWMYWHDDDKTPDEENCEWKPLPDYCRDWNAVKKVLAPSNAIVPIPDKNRGGQSTVEESCRRAMIFLLTHPETTFCRHGTPHGFLCQKCNSEESVPAVTIGQAVDDTHGESSPASGGDKIVAPLNSPTAPTQPPAPLAGGTALAEAQTPREVDLEIGETTSGNINFNMIGGQNITIDKAWAARIRDRLNHLLRNEPTAAGCKEGRPVSPASNLGGDVPMEPPHGFTQTPLIPSDPASGASVSPATGEREAELRECLKNAATSALGTALAAHFAGDTIDQDDIEEVAKVMPAALTPLLDRREGELAALRTLVAKKDEALDWIKKIPTGQLASPEQCSAVVLAMDALDLTPEGIADELAGKDAEIARLTKERDDMRISYENAFQGAEGFKKRIEDLAAESANFASAMHASDLSRASIADFVNIFARENGTKESPDACAACIKDAIEGLVFGLQGKLHVAQSALRESEAAQSALVNSVKFLCSVIRNNQGWSSAVQDHYDYVTRPPSASETEHD